MYLYEVVYVPPTGKVFTSGPYRDVDDAEREVLCWFEVIADPLVMMVDYWVEK